MSDSIQVAIKVRPLIKREKDENLQVQWSVSDNIIVPIDPEKRRGESGFQFDHIFDQKKTNADVFEIVVRPIVDAAVKGFNGTVFAYGQTSSGKTYTMLGTPSEPGVIPMAVERMFDSIAETNGREFLLRVSYLEIYNEKVNDLLDSSAVDLKLREDSNGLVQVLKCKEEIASSPDVIMSIMKKGDKNRRVGETDMNERSSRSHTIFRITIESRDTNSDSDGAIQVSQLNLVDLAGSERARQTNATGERFKEGTHINLSLSTLSLVIKQLSEATDSSKFVNFRDSKLTRLLQASLGGNAMTTIICAVTPAAFEETQCSLSFASRAKSVKNKPQLNEVMSDAALLKRYKKQLAKLAEELEKLKTEKGIAEVEEMESKLQEKEHKLLEKEHELQETDRMNQMLEERIQLLKNSIVSADSAIKEETTTKIPRSKRRRTWAGDRALAPRFSLCVRNLPTIKEISSIGPEPEFNGTTKSDSIRRRKSIIQSVDLNNESFETAFTDFELELIKVQKEREEETDCTIDSVDLRKSTKPKSENRVKFHDDVEVHRFSSGSNWSNVSTPEKRWSMTNQDKIQESSDSPGTPKSILRERLNYLSKEFETLQEFTTLERQIIQAQQLDFDSPNEKVMMQKQIDQLQDRLEKYNIYQTDLEEQLTLCLSCINGLSSRTPDILKLWQPSLFSDEQGEVDCYGELKQLQELLDTLKTEQSNAERELTVLEQKLTNDYNECQKELELVQSQKDCLLDENIEIKKKLADESNKLKNSESLVNDLRNDTDILMEKLVQKNSELSSLKEKIVQLERVNTEMEKTICGNSLDVSTNKEKEPIIDRDSEIARLNEIIQDKTMEIAKLKKFEDEIKAENELLQQSLTALPNSEEFQADINKINEEEISKLREIIQEKILAVEGHQKTETELKEKIEELQKCIENLSKISQESLLDEKTKNENVNINQNFGDEISRLTEIIKKQTDEIENYKSLEEKMKNEMENLQSAISNSMLIDKSVAPHQKYDVIQTISKEKDPEISRLETIIEEKSLEITKYIQSEELARKEIERLQLMLNNSLSIDKPSKENQNKESRNSSNKETPITVDLNQTSNEISGLLDVIQLKSAEIEKYKTSEKEMKNEIERLRKCLEEIEHVHLNQTENQKKQGENTSEISLQIVSYQEEVEKYKTLEQELRDEIKRLQNRVDEIEKASELQMPDVNEDKDTEVQKESNIPSEKNVELEQYQLTIVEYKKEIELLVHKLNELKERESLSNQQTNEITRLSSVIQEKELEITQMRNEIEKMQQELVSLRDMASISEKNNLEIEKYKQIIEETKKEIEFLQQNLNDLESKHAVCQFSSNQQMVEINKLSSMIQEKESEIADVKIQMENLRQQSDNEQVSVEEKNLEIEKYKQIIEASNTEIERLRQSLNELEPKHAEYESTLNLQIEEINKLSAFIQEKESEITGMKKIIEDFQQQLDSATNIEHSSTDEKNREIEKYQQIIEESKKEIEFLRQNLKDIEQKCIDRESLSEGKTEEICRLSNVIQEKESEINQYEQREAEMKKDIEDLQQKLDSASKVGASVECQSDPEQNKESEISKLKGIIEEKILEIDNVKLAEENARKEIERLQEFVDNERESQLTRNEQVIAHDNEKIAKELEFSKQIEIYQQEIENLKKQVKSEMNVVSLSDEFNSKVKDIEELSSLNSELKEVINRKSDEMSELQKTFEVKIQELEKNIETIILERNDLKEKLDSVRDSNVSQDFEKETANLRILVNQLKQENEELRKRIQVLEFNLSKSNSLTTTRESTTPARSTSPIVAISKANDSAMDQTAELEDKPNAPTKSVEDNFVKPSSILPLDRKDSTVVSLEQSRPEIRKNELESSSIFANLTYFDNMDVSQSFAPDCTTLLTGIDETKDVSNISATIDTSMANSAHTGETLINLTPSNESMRNINKSISIQSTSMSTSLNKTQNESFTLEELWKIKAAYEKENSKLSANLKKKEQELEEVQGVIADFKQTLQQLQETIGVLTNENMDMSKLLSEARENNNHVANNLQGEIDTLRSRLSTVTEEKTSLKSELEFLNEKFENRRSITPVTSTDDETKQLLLDYKDKIKILTDENIILSTDLMEKIEELERVKESKVQLYDHECTYKERAGELLEKIQALEKENIELSSDLTEQIEECDMLKETANVLKQQLDAFKNQSICQDSNKDDLEFLKEENTRLTSELIELRAKLTQLSRENANLSSNLALDNSDEANESKNKSSTALETSVSENTDETGGLSLSKKVKFLEEKIEHLTSLNKKLSELKLTSCKQCAHLKELNESRRLLKLEVKSLTQKISELQKEYEQKCTETEGLRKKASEDFNTSLSFMDSTFNGSITDGVNVTIIEEKVQHLHNELEELKENHNKLSNQYEEKCSELKKLQLDNSMSNPEEKPKTRRSKTPSRSKSSRIQSLQEQLENVSSDLQEIKKSNTNCGGKLNKFMADHNETLKEIESLKLSHEEMKKECDNAKECALKHEEKVKLLEEELSTLYKQIESLNAKENQTQAQKLEMEVQLESLFKEKSELEEKSKNKLEVFSIQIQDQEKENTKLKNELQKLQNIIQQIENKTNSSIEERLRDEIDSAKVKILKEMKSLTSLSENELKELPKKSVTDIFISFLNAILSKETEVVNRLHEESEKKFKKLEEEKQQSIDSEKRANVWAKTVEADLEKLQGDLTEQEHKNKRLRDEIHRLDEHLKEAQHENQQLHNNITNLESDIISLHNELDKKVKNNSDRDSAISAAQEKEKMARFKENEWEDHLAQEKEKYERELEELNTQLENQKSISDDLRNTVEGLDLEIEHLKNTIDIKNNEIGTYHSKIKELRNEMRDMEDMIQQLRNENVEKNKNMEEITILMKIKCDLLTEYKHKVETMNPEFESLQAQITERKALIDKYKDEIHNLKLENKKQADIMQDKLSSEEIKSAGLTKQLNELKNKNTALCTTIEEFKDRCAELERENANLQRKVRNSTSKVRVESEMQELQDENRSLKNHLEGSYNRIKELQESKSQVQRELSEVQGKCALLEQELNTTRISLESLREKYNNMNLQKLREKYETVLREKNNIVLEVEEKKMLLASKDQQLVEYGIEMDTLKKQKEFLNKELENMRKENSSLEYRISDFIVNNDKLNARIEACNNERNIALRIIEEEKEKLAAELEHCHREIENLQTKNKELDTEMDELVTHIHKQDDEIAELQDRLITGSLSTEKLDELKNLRDENDQLKINLRVTEVNYTKLNAEKEALISRIEDLNSKIGVLECKNSSRSSSKSNSPNTQKGRRRRRRSDIYNQNRNLDLDEENKESYDTDSPMATPTPPLINRIDEECKTCCELRNRIREMSLDLVSRNNKITMLEVQLQAENFPYQMKCNELQENLLAVKTRNSELKLEIQKFKRALMEDSSRECQVCRHRKLNRRDQAVQVNQETKISLAGVSSGMVEDYVRLEKMEKERNWMKDLCRNRAKKIKDLEQRIKELEGITTI